MTVKELQKLLGQEKYDVKNARVFINVEGQRFNLESADIYDNEVHLTVGEPEDIDAERIGDE